MFGSDYFEKALHFSEIFENRQSHIFKLAQMQLFQDFNNYGATQDATTSRLVRESRMIEIQISGISLKIDILLQKWTP